MDLVFGTDGVRGRVGRDIDEIKVLSLGIASAKYLKTKKVYLGRDTRESSLALARALTEGLNRSGIEVISLGVAPTPEIAHAAKVDNAGGAVISASHNIWSDNGVKLFGLGGLKISDAIQDLIQIDWENEQRKNHTIKGVDLEDVNDDRWINSLISSAKPDSFTGLSVVLDCANGATVNKASMVFEELGATVLEVSSNPDGKNINQNCGSNNPENLIQNRGDKTFLKKWGITTKFFKKHYLKSKTKYNGPLNEPNVTIGYILGLLSCKIQSIFLLY